MFPWEHSVPFNFLFMCRVNKLCRRNKAENKQIFESFLVSWLPFLNSPSKFRQSSPGVESDERSTRRSFSSPIGRSRC
ncbi:hypothetical protein CUMW_133720 [Citrus unshiu]|nr:hypothetical protein CUMW_133720 [Citrus unshiu]